MIILVDLLKVTSFIKDNTDLESGGSDFRFDQGFSEFGGFFNCWVHTLAIQDPYNAAMDTSVYT